VRDRLKALQKGGLVSALGQIFSDSGETLSAISLARKLAPAGRDLEKMSGLMDKHWRTHTTDTQPRSHRVLSARRPSAPA
jgi:hypothetical protein